MSTSETIEKETTTRPPRIGSEVIYSLEQARAELGLSPSCLRREVRLRRLRVSRRGGRYMIPASWLLEWIMAGEIKRPG
jgi:hypothetical protein